MNEVHKALCRARNLIDREGWCQGELRNGEGAMCIHGAVNAAAPSREVNVAVRAVLADLVGGGIPFGTVEWNNTPGRTEAEVLDAFDKAIAQTAPPPADPFPATQELEPERSLTR